MFPHLLVPKVSSKYRFHFLTVPPSISTLLLLLQVLSEIHILKLGLVVISFRPHHLFDNNKHYN